MRTIAMLVLGMLIGGYGAAQAQNQMTPEEDAAKTEEATKDFLGLKWGAGIGVIGSFGGEAAVEKASIDENKIVRIDEEGDMRPQVFLEMHVFLDKKARDWRSYQRRKEQARMATAMKVKMKVEEGAPIAPDWPPMPEPPLTGIGPFIALQSSDNKAIDALTLGVMWGIRRDPQKEASLNIGLGLSFDPTVQVLGDGMKEAQVTAEKAVRFKKEGRFGWALMTSFTF
nr:hypothetical protein [uncultured bacterium]